MYRAILVVNYMICEQTPAGNLPYNNVGTKYVKTIEGMSPEDCTRQVEKFLADANFKEIKK